MDDSDWVVSIFGSLGFFAGIALIVNYFWAMKVRRAMADTPTSKIRSAAMGLVELKGLSCEWEHALKAPFSNTDCVWFKWQVEEERVEHTRHGRQRRWIEIGGEESFRPFGLEDDTGQIKINPEGAEIDAVKLLSYTSSGLMRSHSAPSTPAAARYLASPNRVRLTEWRIDLSFPLYILGELRKIRLEDGQTENQVTQSRGQRDAPFVISTKTEEELNRSFFWRSVGSALAGAVLTVVCAAALAYNFGFSRYGDVELDIFVVDKKKSDSSIQANKQEIKETPVSEERELPSQGRTAPQDGSY